MVYPVSQLNGRKPTLEDEREALLLNTAATPSTTHTAARRRSRM